jgi:hypothetical protein
MIHLGLISYCGVYRILLREPEVTTESSWWVASEGVCFNQCGLVRAMCLSIELDRKWWAQHIIFNIQLDPVGLFHCHLIIVQPWIRAKGRSKVLSSSRSWIYHEYEVAIKASKCFCSTTLAKLNLIATLDESIENHFNDYSSNDKTLFRERRFNLENT